MTSVLVASLVLLGVWGGVYALLAEVLDRMFWDHRRKLERTTNGR